MGIETIIFDLFLCRCVDSADELGVGDLSVVEVLVRKVPDDQRSIDLRVAVLGNVDVGKSTLIGVLTQGEPSAPLRSFSSCQRSGQDPIESFQGIQ